MISASASSRQYSYVIGLNVLTIGFAVAAITSLRPLVYKLLILPSPIDLRNSLRRLRIAKTETMNANRWLSLGEAVAHIGHWRLYQGDNMIRYSDGIARIFGGQIGKFSGLIEDFYESIVLDDRANVIDSIDNAFAHRNEFDVAARIARSNGEIRHILLRGAVRVDSSEDRLTMFGVCVDQTEQKLVEFELLQARAATEAANERLEALASRDILTGLVNRRHFDRMLDEEIRRTSRLGIPISLVVVAVDQFLAVSTTHGNGAAETCLVAVALALEGTAHRAGDLVGRLSTQRFGLLLPGTDAAGAMTVAARVLDAVQKRRRSDAASPVEPVSVSIGIVLLKEHNSRQSSLSMMEHGEKACHQAQQKGGNQARLVTLT
jgi:diguanylate cyclase (GGDEF)-like protein